MSTISPIFRQPREIFLFIIMSSIDHEYNNFLLIQFLLSNIMILVLSILTIYHCILSHFMIATIRILSLFNIFQTLCIFFLLARAFGVAVGCNIRSIFLHFLRLFGSFSNDVCSMVILTLQLLFHVNPFYFWLYFGSPYLFWEIFPFLICLNAFPFLFFT